MMLRDYVNQCNKYQILLCSVLLSNVIVIYFADLKLAMKDFHMAKHKQPQLKDNKVVIYQSKSGALELKTDIVQETIWLAQQQTAALFDVQKAAISKHVRNIFDSGELQPKATVSKMETAALLSSSTLSKIFFKCLDKGIVRFIAGRREWGSNLTINALFYL